MLKHCEYDQENKVIVWTITRTPSTAEGFTEAYAEIIKLAQSLPEKVFLFVDWKDAVIPPLRQAFFRPFVVEVLKHVRGIVRYNMANLEIRMQMRKDTINATLEDTRMYIYPSKEIALEAIHKGELR
jgi:hypothetical protein